MGGGVDIDASNCRVRPVVAAVATRAQTRVCLISAAALLETGSQVTRPSIVIP